MSRAYYVDWLRPAHAGAVARLERKVYPADYRAGRKSIREDLEHAERDHSNLSMGAFHRGKLVGFVLAFFEPERARICEYLDIQAPQGVDLSGPGVYLNDLVVHPRHGGAGSMLCARLAHVARTRDDMRTIPVDTFSTDTMADTWAIKARFLARHGIQLAERRALQLAAGGEELHWLVFRHIEEKARSTASLTARLKSRRSIATSNGAIEIGFYDSVADWSALQPHWNALLNRTAGGTVFQTFEYLHTWWALLGLKNQLLLVVALRGEQPVAIAPMQITPRKWLGRELRHLTFVGHPSEVDRNTLLLDPGAHDVIEHIADFLLACNDRWDCAALYEQPPTDEFVKTFSAKLRTARYIVSTAPGPECAVVSTAGHWENFLATKSRSFRKSVRRKLAQLDTVREARFDSVGAAEEVSAALERYAQVESSSWKPAAGLGIAKSSSHRQFYNQIVKTFATLRAAKFRFLSVAGRDVAATFGLCWDRTFYSLHIAHDDMAALHSPGVTLTALELRAAFAEREYDTFDFLAGFMTNKSSWATTTLPTVALFAHRRDWRGWLFHRLYFTVRPALRRWLVQFGLLTAALRLKNAALWLRSSLARS
jgi:CelD/BcsL family acetyltransferase involved in cellulose biosynthesis